MAKLYYNIQSLFIKVLVSYECLPFYIVTKNERVSDPIQGTKSSNEMRKKLPLLAICCLYDTNCLLK